MSDAVDEQSRLARLLQRYPGDEDVIWAVTQIESRACRVRKRDDAIRVARAHFPGSIKASAEALARALAAYYCSGWPGERHLSAPPDAEPRHHALHQILRLNCGRPLAYRRIMDIFK